MTLREALGGIGGKIKRGFRAIMGWDIDPYGFDQSQAAPKATAPTAKSVVPDSVAEAEEARTPLTLVAEKAQELKRQLDEVKLQLKNITEQRDEARHEVEELRGKLTGLSVENARLTEQIHIAEAFLGQSLDEYIEYEIENYDAGQEYYDEHREEWEEEGIDNYEMRDRVREYAKQFSVGRNDVGKRSAVDEVLDFSDAPRTDIYNSDDKIDSALTEAKLGNAAAVPREMKAGPFERKKKDDDENNVF